ncbi:hypothetical protein CHS0354_017182 [Potamilus streckersoni]|uniref:G-protein coupled receptors family 1 profile domain-containing protein n=1 Tax=Potamilus streckersoni TaxID=2493646 RepID=A0AAE0T2X6_9BIVA|nr:hypothetical protein CHS0354_017182 [Potamilus streckersoni]
MAQILCLVTMCVHWSAVLKISAEKKKFISAKVLKIVVVFVWIVSSVVGLFPTIGVTSDPFQKDMCTFLTFDLGMGFTIFFIVLIFATVLTSAICVIDATVLLKYMKQVAEIKYQAGRFYLPDKRTSVPSSGTCTILERYHRLNFAWDLSKFILVFTILSFFMNHVPYAVLQCLQAFSGNDREWIEVTVLWLILLEALLMPHALWILSKRYRHALVYGWKVHILRKSNFEEDDPLSCTLQSYTRYIRREHDRTSRPVSRISENGNLENTLPRSHAKSNGRAGTPNSHNSIEEVNTNSLRKQNGICSDEILVQSQIEVHRLDHINMVGDESPRSKIHVNVVRQNSGSSSSASNESHNGKEVTLNPKEDITRSSSSSSRKNWKEQMRKKHLPAIFVNEAFDAQETKNMEKKREKKIKEKERERDKFYKTETESGSVHSMHYYMSSDYHPDYLTESLPRQKSQQESESEGVSGQYEEGDICNILDNLSSNSSESSEFRRRKVETSSKRQRSSATQPEPSNDSFREKTGDPGSDKSASHEVMKTNIEEGINQKEILRFKLKNNVKSNRPDLASEKQEGVSLGTFKRETTVYTEEVVFEGRTSFGRVEQVQNDSNFSDYFESSRYSTDQLELNSLNSSITNNHSVFHNKDRLRLNRQLNNGDKTEADREDNSSVTITVLKDKNRQTPWKDDTEDPVIEMKDHIKSDTDTLKNFNTCEINGQLLSPPLEDMHSELSTPTSIFDDETDRGFEEALEVNFITHTSIYGGMGISFDTIKEEPEDLTSSSSNPFMDVSSSSEEEPFKTHAVVSKRPDSRSTTSSMSDNPFDNVPVKSSTDLSGNYHSQRQGIKPVRRLNDEPEVEDSVFEFSNALSNRDVVARDNLSPWPDTNEPIKEDERSFDSDFSNSTFQNEPRDIYHARTTEMPLTNDIEPVYF